MIEEFINQYSYSYKEYFTLKVCLYSFLNYFDKVYELLVITVFARALEKLKFCFGIMTIVVHGKVMETSFENVG